MFKEVEEGSQLSLNVERSRGTFGSLIVYWTFNGSLEDIAPTSGMVNQSALVTLCDVWCGS